MSTSYELQGEIHSIGDTQTFGNNGFTKREFVLKLTGEGENSAYPNYVALELIKDKCGLMDSYTLGDEIKVQFNLNGRLWAGNGQGEKCFTSLQAWRITPLSAVQPTATSTYEAAFNEAPPAYDYDQAPASDKNYDDEIPF